MAGRSTRSSARKATGYYAEDDDEDFVPVAGDEHDSDEFEPEPVVKKPRGRPARRSQRTSGARETTPPVNSSASFANISVDQGLIPSGAVPFGSDQQVSIPLATVPYSSAPIASSFVTTSAAPTLPISPTIPDYPLLQTGLYNHYNIPEGEEARLAEYIRGLPAVPTTFPPINSCDICKEPFTNESPVFLPCGHIYGNTCACSLVVCHVRRCKISLYHGCGHPVCFRPAYEWQKWIRQVDKVPEKCVECTVKDIDCGMNIRGYKTLDLLHKIAELEVRQQQLLAMENLGSFCQETATIGQELYTARQNLQWMEKIVAEMYMAAEVYGL